MRVIERVCLCVYVSFTDRRKYFEKIKNVLLNISNFYLPIIHRERMKVRFPFHGEDLLRKDVAIRWRIVRYASFETIVSIKIKAFLGRKLHPDMPEKTNKMIQEKKTPKW